MAGWGRHFFYRKEVWKTTWTFRLSVLVLVIVTALLTRSLLADRIGKSLVCEERADPSDAILVENFDPEYLSFERAATLKSAGVASRVFVPVSASADPEYPDASSNGVVAEFARVAHLANLTVIPVRQMEPITLNVATDVRDFLLKEHIRSVVFVTPGFRSRRSVLVYEKIFTPAGIKFECVPVFGNITPGNWTTEWHGIQDVVLQFAKLQYYRFYVLRRYVGQARNLPKS
jgi:hypothetical protein